MKNIIKTFKLDNGLKVLFYPVKNLPIVNVNLWANVGSVNEPLNINGISHFLEHMLFKDTQKYKNNSLTKEIEDLGGGYMNAATSVDYTHYYVTIHKDFASRAFDVLSDMAFNLDIDQKNLDLERGVIIEEIQRGNDNPWNVLWEHLYAKIFKGHNYVNPIIGNKKNIKNISRADLHGYYDKFYAPDNLTLVVAGDLDFEEVKKLSEKYFNVKKSTQNIEKVTYHPQKIEGKKYYEKSMATVNQTYFAYAYDVKDTPAMHLLDIMLGGGVSSILHKRLKQDESLVWFVGTDFSSHKYGATFIVYGLCDHKNLVKIDEILQEKIVLTQEDLDKAKRIFKLQFELENETVSDITDNLGYYEIFSKWQDFYELKEAVLKVELNDLKLFDQKKFIRQVVTN